MGHLRRGFGIYNRRINVEGIKQKECSSMKILIFLIVLAIAPWAWAQSSYRCGSYVVDAGNDQGEVLGKCGAPTYKHIESVQTQGFIAGGTRRIGPGATAWGGAFSTQTEQVEVWTYDCGEGTIIHHLNFKGGKLNSIKTGGRSVGPSRCQ